MALAAAAIFDWSQPPARQISPVIYKKLILGSYRTLIHPITSHVIRCPFRPSCSGYSELAVQRFGFAKGSWLTAKRLLRCTPWVKYGTVDLVPAKS